jgi:hypothetical protein
VIPSCLLVVCFENWFESKCKRAAKDSLLPSKYKCEYEETYNVYRNWSSIKKIKTCEDSEVSIPFLKRKGEGYKPKKFLVLTKEQIYEFLIKADTKEHLYNKVKTFCFEFTKKHNLLGYPHLWNLRCLQTSRTTDIIDNIC